VEHLVYDLMDKLVLRREIEYNKVLKLDKAKDKELILIYSGKIIELDFLIGLVNEMLAYFNQTKEIAKRPSGV
jgi:hypothetical protein